MAPLKVQTQIHWHLNWWNLTDHILKYRDKKKDKERFDWQVYETYVPFDKESIYNKYLKAGKAWNKTALLIKPKFCTQVTQDILKTELDKFNNANENPLPTHNPVISDKNILL